MDDIGGGRADQRPRRDHDHRDQEVLAGRLRAISAGEQRRDQQRRAGVDQDGGQQHARVLRLLADECEPGPRLAPHVVAQAPSPDTSQHAPDADEPPGQFADAQPAPEGQEREQRQWRQRAGQVLRQGCPHDGAVVLLPQHAVAARHVQAVQCDHHRRQRHAPPRQHGEAEQVQRHQQRERDSAQSGRQRDAHQRGGEQAIRFGVGPGGDDGEFQTQASADAGDADEGHHERVQAEGRRVVQPRQQRQRRKERELAQTGGDGHRADGARRRAVPQRLPQSPRAALQVCHPARTPTRRSAFLTRSGRKR